MLCIPDLRQLAYQFYSIESDKHALILKMIVSTIRNSRNKAESFKHPTLEPPGILKGDLVSQDQILERTRALEHCFMNGNAMRPGGTISNPESSLYCAQPLSQVSLKRPYQESRQHNSNSSSSSTKSTTSHHHDQTTPSKIFKQEATENITLTPSSGNSSRHDDKHSPSETSPSPPKVTHPSASELLNIVSRAE